MSSVKKNTLPEGWEEKKLKEYLIIQNGFAFSSKKFNDNGKGTPLIRIRNLKKSNITTYYDGDYNDKFIVTKGDFLIGMDGEFRCYEWNNENALLNQRVCRITDVNKNLDSRFLFYGINKFLIDIEAVTAFVTVKHISARQINEINFPIPPLEEQKRLVAKIDGLFAKIDKAISLTEESLKQAKNLFPSVLKEVFEKGKADCWKDKKLEEVCDVIGGGTPKTKISEYWDGEIVWLSPIDLPPIGEISIVCDSRKKITDVGLKKSSAKLLPKGSVVYSTRASIGKIAIAEIPLSTNQGFTNFICGEGLNNRYLCFCLKHFNKTIENLSNSTTFKEVSKSAMKEFEIPVPSIDSQMKVVKTADEVLLKSKQTQSKLEEQLTYLKQLKSSILSKAFKGEL
jgi:type I restriction enzyme S subunit